MPWGACRETMHVCRFLFSLPAIAWPFWPKVKDCSIQPDRWRLSAETIIPCMNPVAHALEVPAGEALNQVPLLTNYNLFLTDASLVKAVEREGAGWAREQISELGRLLGTEEVQRWGFDANE